MNGFHIREIHTGQFLVIDPLGEFYQSRGTIPCQVAGRPGECGRFQSRADAEIWCRNQTSPSE